MTNFEAGWSNKNRNTRGKAMTDWVLAGRISIKKRKLQLQPEEMMNLPRILGSKILIRKHVIDKKFPQLGSFSFDFKQHYYKIIISLIYSHYRAFIKNCNFQHKPWKNNNIFHPITLNFLSLVRLKYCLKLFDVFTMLFLPFGLTFFNHGVPNGFFWFGSKYLKTIWHFLDLKFKVEQLCL